MHRLLGVTASAILVSRESSLAHGGPRMPYHIEHKGGKRPYKLVKSATGKVVGSSVSMTMAKKALGALYASESRRKTK